MPIFHRTFVNQDTAQGARTFNPEHLANVGPRLPVQIGITEKLASTYADQGQEIPTPIDGYALFDTGASRTCVDEAVLRNLGLQPVERISMATPSGLGEASIYTCALYFPGYPLPDLDPSFVAGVQLQGQDYIALIGRDILRNMILIYDGPGARVTFAF